MWDSNERVKVNRKENVQFNLPFFLFEKRKEEPHLQKASQVNFTPEKTNNFGQNTFLTVFLNNKEK